MAGAPVVGGAAAAGLAVPTEAPVWFRRCPGGCGDAAAASVSLVTSLYGFTRRRKKRGGRGEEEEEEDEEEDEDEDEEEDEEVGQNDC